MSEDFKDPYEEFNYAVGIQSMPVDVKVSLAFGGASLLLEGDKNSEIVSFTVQDTKAVKGALRKAAKRVGAVLVQDFDPDDRDIRELVCCFTVEGPF